jgi:hypothetical protein
MIFWAICNQWGTRAVATPNQIPSHLPSFLFVLPEVWGSEQLTRSTIASPLSPFLLLSPSYSLQTLSRFSPSMSGGSNDPFSSNKTKWKQIRCLSRSQLFHCGGPLSAGLPLSQPCLASSGSGPWWDHPAAALPIWSSPSLTSRPTRSKLKRKYPADQPLLLYPIS